MDRTVACVLQHIVCNCNVFRCKYGGKRRASSRENMFPLQVAGHLLGVLHVESRGLENISGAGLVRGDK